jgi:CpXC protein
MLAMAIVGVTRVRCPACDREHECQLVQSINTHTNPAAKAQLLAGELNVLACPCGRRTQLAATVLYHDLDADYWCQVCPGGEQAMAEGEAAFRVAGVTGRQRLVPSLNALVEKVKLLDAGLEDWAIEMTKVLLLASLEDRDLDRVLLFDSLDGETIRWVMFEPSGGRVVTSPLRAYTKLAARTQARPAPRELRIDRAWAIGAVRTMIADAN